jgi:hypothetical protein
MENSLALSTATGDEDPQQRIKARIPLKEEQRKIIKSIINAIQQSSAFLDNDYAIANTEEEKKLVDINKPHTTAPLRDIDIRHARVVITASDTDDITTWTDLPKRFWKKPIRFQSEEHQALNNAYCVSGYSLDIHNTMVKEHGALWLYLNVVFGTSFPVELRGERSVLQPVRRHSHTTIYE